MGEGDLREGERERRRGEEKRSAWVVKERRRERRRRDFLQSARSAYFVLLVIQVTLNKYSNLTAEATRAKQVEQKANTERAKSVDV